MIEFGLTNFELYLFAWNMNIYWLILQLFPTTTAGVIAGWSCWLTLCNSLDQWKTEFSFNYQKHFFPSIPNCSKPFSTVHVHAFSFHFVKWQKSSVADFMINKIAGTNLPFFTLSRLYKWISFVRLNLAESSKASGNNRTQFHLFKKIVRI